MPQTCVKGAPSANKACILDCGALSSGAAPMLPTFAARRLYFSFKGELIAITAIGGTAPGSVISYFSWHQNQDSKFEAGQDVGFVVHSQGCAEGAGGCGGVEHWEGQAAAYFPGTGVSFVDEGVLGGEV